MTDLARLGSRLRLYVVTDPAARGGLVPATRAALSGGATAIQLRWKDASARQLMEAGRQIASLRETHDFLFIVNDRLDVALALGADGVHLGDDDIPLPAARAIAPSGVIFGRSVDSVEEAEAAERQGADYLGAGPVYPTGSKVDTGPVMGLDGLRRISEAVTIPVVGIGGISNETIRSVGRNAAGAAVLGAVMFSDDARRATQSLHRQLNAG